MFKYIDETPRLKAKMQKYKDFPCFQPLSDAVFIMLINIKMPTNVGILAFKSLIFIDS